jgi:hypothetical protein
VTLYLVARDDRDRRELLKAVVDAVAAVDVEVVVGQVEPPDSDDTMRADEQLETKVVESANRELGLAEERRRHGDHATEGQSPPKSDEVSTTPAKGHDPIAAAKSAISRLNAAGAVIRFVVASIQELVR